MTELVRYGWPLLIAALFGLGAWIAPALKAKFKNEAVLSLLARAERLAGQVVLELDQVMVQAMKADNDGKLSSEDMRRVATLAMERLKKMLGTKGLAELNAALGDLERSLRTMLEAKVRELRLASPGKQFEGTLLESEPADRGKS